MKTSRFTEAQIAFVLKEAEDGAPIAGVCRKAGISDATFYNWRKKYARPSSPLHRSERTAKLMGQRGQN